MSIAAPRVLAAAFDDVDSARRWYEGQHAGLGSEFVRAVEVAAAAALAFPQGQPIIHRQARRVLLRRFPYCLFYRIDGEGITIVACLHAARDPKLVDARLGDEGE